MTSQNVLSALLQLLRARDAGEFRRLARIVAESQDEEYWLLVAEILRETQKGKP